MAEVILYGIAQEILKNLGSSVLKEIASTWGFKDQLEKLNNSITLIKDVLLDAEQQQADSHAVRRWLEQLTTVVYSADDMFDEFNTIVSHKKLLGGNNVCKEVHSFFSSSNQIAFAFKLSRKVKSIRKNLEAIRKEGAELGLAQRALQQGSVTPVSRETHSYVDADEVIGRDDDKKAILDLLLAGTENEQELEVLQVIPIVGIGGMGKTTLAQLLYNDPQVKEYFELRLWVCVAEDFDTKVITRNILGSTTATDNNMEKLQCQLRDKIGGKKYLLVLDDVWEENPNRWDELRALLKVGRKGSKILVTTRLRKVADIVRTFPSYELQGLSENKSWALFEKKAFDEGVAEQKPKLVEVGKEIVKKCVNVPLAIKTLGGLLRGQDERKWLSFKDENLTEVMDVLKLSYQHLQSHLKNCFVYCALFPKDYVFDKEMMIELWMAEGFVYPSVNGYRSLEDVAEDYFVNMLQRGFFQDVERNELGDITSCKMHDLMHDLAQQVATGKCKVVDSRQYDFEDTILHLSFTDYSHPSCEISNQLLNLKLLRTILYGIEFVFGYRESACRLVVSNFRYLRVLDLHNLQYQTLPNSIGKLIHLRYLNLSCSKIETLPKSITKLYNLQTLNLSGCWKLRKLPKNIHKLANLRSLDIRWCFKLTYLPSGIGRSTLLHKLSTFIVSHKQSVELMKKPKSTAKLSDLKKLNNIRKQLSIHIHGTSEDNKLQEMEEDVISNKHGLMELDVSFYSEETCEADRKNHDEAVMEGLKPHCNLRELSICNYGGEKLPSWAVTDNLCKTLPNLVRVSLENCRNCQQVPSFSELRFLKRLELHNMGSVVYMESYTSSSSRPLGFSNLFFPSLEELRLDEMENLKGWWKVTEADASSNDEQQHNHYLLSLQFLKLSKLEIMKCPNLIFMPLCPSLEELQLIKTNRNLSLVKKAPISLSTSLFPWSSRLKRLVLHDVEDLISLSRLGLGSLSNLRLDDEKLKSTERLGEVFATLSFSLRSLDFLRCTSLRCISKGLEHLTALEKLTFCFCGELVLSSSIKGAAENESEDMMPWIALKYSLRSLRFCYLPKVGSLPSGIQRLTNLRELKLQDMEELMEVPEWISCLSSLRSLMLDRCPKLTSLPQSFQNLTSLDTLHIRNSDALTKRCQRPDGADWPNICHIPNVNLFAEGRD